LTKTVLGRGKLNHRFRLEQRWITSTEFGTDFSARARYMLQYTRPIGAESIQPGTWFVQAFDEIFIDFDRNGYWFNLEGFDSGLNQNRLYLGAGKQLTPLSNFRIGMLWQHRPNAGFWRLLISYSHNFDFPQ